MAVKILIIEDDPIIAADLQSKLTSLDYKVIGSTDEMKEAKELTYKYEPQLILSDIVLEQRDYDGIDIINHIFKDYRTALIYLTANSELSTVKRATSSQPAAFLLKPFRIQELAINIDLALKKFEEEQSFHKVNNLVDDSIFIPNNSAYIRLQKNKILYVEADGSYTKVFTQEKTYSMTLNLKHFNKQLDDGQFIRVSRKHVVNSNHIDRIDGRTLYLSSGKAITISRSKTQEILDHFPILKTK